MTNWTTRLRQRRLSIPDFLKVDADVLMKGNMDSIDKFDKFMFRLSNGQYRLPTLFKKYLKLNAKFFCFNVDPDFNDTLDSLAFPHLHRLPRGRGDAAFPRQQRRREGNRQETLRVYLIFMQFFTQNTLNPQNLPDANLTSHCASHSSAISACDNRYSSDSSSSMVWAKKLKFTFP